jgi:hypothetical protein
VCVVCAASGYEIDECPDCDASGVGVWLHGPGCWVCNPAFCGECSSGDAVVHDPGDEGYDWRCERCGSEWSHGPG